MVGRPAYAHVIRFHDGFNFAGNLVQRYMGNSSAILRRNHWIFDLDGTLTLPVHDFAAIRQDLGVPVGADILGYLASLPEAEAYPLQRKLAEIEDELAGRTVAAAGARTLVEHLSRRGARLGVLTRNTRENALRTLEMIGLRPFISPVCVLGRDEALPKPDPDGILKLAAQWETLPATVVMVGDYQFDLQTGRAAGAATIHVDHNRLFRWPELTDIAVGTLEELTAGLQDGI
jgi:HAD superfamily hydrolase (TIGR01509 family)